MQLKEEFRSYEALRREHDSQIIQIAMESGLRIAPDQWSSLLYGDTNHKSHMQSIIDKVSEIMISHLSHFHFDWQMCIIVTSTTSLTVWQLQTPQSFTQSTSELVVALQRSGDPCNLQRLRPHLEFLASIDPSPGMEKVNLSHFWKRLIYSQSITTIIFQTAWSVYCLVFCLIC